jgi:hypothetical protein
MTELRSQSQRYYTLTEVGETHSKITAAEEDAIDDAAAGALPPITNALVLQECLPPEVLARLREELKFLEGYLWFSEENVNRAANCCIAAVSYIQDSGPPWVGDNFPNTRRPGSFGKPKDHKFFIEQIVNLHRRDVDAYDHDRALNAVRINGSKKPRRYDDIPKSFQKTSAPTGRYELVKREFSWPSPVPDRVIDAVNDFTIRTPPDDFWIADYVFRQTQASYDPIIYARFGDWHVEVARWD